MNEENKPSRAKRSAAKNMEDKLYGKAEVNKPENKTEELIGKMLESRQLSEERMLAMFQSNQDQLSRAQLQLSSALEALQDQLVRKTEPPVRETSIIVEPATIFDRRHINRKTDRLFAFCESSYIYFKEEPISVEEGPGPHKPLPSY
jgi:hypothetical protein